MNVEYHKSWSNQLGQEMDLKVYGQTGKPALVFPTLDGRFYQYEDFGMVEAVRPFIDEGKIQLYTVDSIDRQSWINPDAPPAERAKRHNQYDAYIVQEVVPFIHEHNPFPGKLLATGCSMGGYHSANFTFRHPDLVDALIALSGIYSLKLCIGDYMDENVYMNTPLAYLPNLNDRWYLEQYRQSQIIVCAGQGAWEEPMLDETRQLDRILTDKGIPHWADFWGYDVDHDWPWWRKMEPYFLGAIFSGEVERHSRLT